MRPQTQKDKIRRLKELFYKAVKAYDEQGKKERKKGKGLTWLIKIEYHT